MKTKLSALRMCYLSICLILIPLASETFAQVKKREPVIWRQLISGSTTIKSAFITRSPQFILYRSGLIIYRSGQSEGSYLQVQLSEDERAYLLRSMEGTYRLTGLTPGRLKREDPYIASVQKRLDPNNKDTIVLWMGMHNPPSLHRYSQTLLEARSGNNELGPAWNMLYECSQYLSTFAHPRAKPLVPDEIEIAVQPLPSYLSDQADSAKPWPLTDITLQDIKGTRNRGFKNLSGDQAQRAYRFLAEQSIVSDGGKVYEVWVRPVLVPKR